MHSGAGLSHWPLAKQTARRVPSKRYPWAHLNSAIASNALELSLNDVRPLTSCGSSSQCTTGIIKLFPYFFLLLYSSILNLSIDSLYTYCLPYKERITRLIKIIFSENIPISYMADQVSDQYTYVLSRKYHSFKWKAIEQEKRVLFSLWIILKPLNLVLTTYLASN